MIADLQPNVDQVRNLVFYLGAGVGYLVGIATGIIATAIHFTRRRNR